MNGLTLCDAVRAVRTRRVSARDETTRLLARIDRLDATLSCYREIYAEHALDAAQRIDDRIDQGEEPGPLAGAVISVKDNLATDFGTTCCGSRMLEGYRSPFTATAVQRLIDAGAIIIGKTNCDEFGMGSSTEHCAYGTTRNPWDGGCVAGGSSGGAAAAVAAGLCHAAIGSDSGGSLRQPAAMCGVVGLKPTYGRVSRYGLVAYGSSLDQVGPITQNVADAAALLQVMSGIDPHDSTSTNRPIEDVLANIDAAVDGVRLGVPKQYRRAENHPEVTRSLLEAVEVYRELGATIVDVDLPLTDYGIATYYVIAPAEASSNLARYDGVRYGRRASLRPGEGLDELYARSRSDGFGAEVRRRIMLGTYVLSAGYYEAYYGRAMKARRLINEEFDRAFEQCHAILGPTSPFPAFRLGEKLDPMSMYLCDVYTTNTNIAGICAVSLPCGFADVGGRRLPLGLQLQCPAFDEMTLLRIARQYESATSHGATTPPLPSSSQA